MTTRVPLAASHSADFLDTPDYRGWFIQPYRAAFRYGYWRGASRTSGKTRHDRGVTQPAH